MCPSAELGIQSSRYHRPHWSQVPTKRWQLARVRPMELQRGAAVQAADPRRVLGRMAAPG